MLLDPAQARLEIADDEPMTGHGRVVLDRRAAPADDLLARLLLDPADLLSHDDEVRGDIGPQRIGLEAKIGSGRHLGAHIPDLTAHVADLRAHVGEELQDQASGLGTHPIIPIER